MLCAVLALLSSGAIYPPQYKVRVSSTGELVFNGSIFNDLDPESGELYKAEFERAMYNLMDIDVEAVRNLSEAQYPPAMHVMGDLELLGIEHPPNLTRAAWYFEGAARLGFSESLVRLAFLHRYGLGVDRDSAKDALYRQVACDKGSFYACVSQAWSYFLGVGVPESVETALDSLLQVDNTSPFMYLGRPHGLLRGNLKLDNEGERLSVEKRANMMNDLISGGRVEAELYLALRYYLGDRVAQDFDRAREMLEQFQNNVLALVILGTMHFKGQGVPVNLERARNYLERAVQKGHDWAMAALAELLDRMGEYDRAWEMTALAGDRGVLSALAIATRKTVAGSDPLGQIIRDQYGNRSLEMRSSGYIPDRMWYSLTQASAYAWTRVVDVAEELWMTGRREGAILLWLQLADAGVAAAMFNVMRALQMCEHATNSTTCFIPDPQRWKLVSQVGRRFIQGWPGFTLSRAPSVVEWVQDADKAYGKNHHVRRLVKRMQRHKQESIQLWSVKDRLRRGVPADGWPSLFGDIFAVVMNDNTREHGLVLLVKAVQSLLSTFVQWLASGLDKDFGVFLRCLYQKILGMYGWLAVFLLLWLIRMRVALICAN